MRQGAQGWCSGDEPEKWDGEGGRTEGQDGGTHVHPWLTHVNVWQKPPQYCKGFGKEELPPIKINKILKRN